MADITRHNLDNHIPIVTHWKPILGILRVGDYAIFH